MYFSQERVFIIFKSSYAEWLKGEWFIKIIHIHWSVYEFKKRLKNISIQTLHK